MTLSESLYYYFGQYVEAPLLAIFENVEPFNVGLIFSGVMVVLVFLGVRVFLAAAVVGMLGLVAIIGWEAGTGMAGTVPHSKISSFTLSVLPMFILIGYLAFHAGLTQAVFDAARKWCSQAPGGLAIATVFATAGFAAVSGASTATAAVFSRVAIPEMLKNGYDKRLAAGVVAAGGTLASLIPPSAILVIYAIIVEESVGQLLLAGFIPGIISAVIYAAVDLGKGHAESKAGADDRTLSLVGTFQVPAWHCSDCGRYCHNFYRYLWRLGNSDRGRSLRRVCGNGNCFNPRYEIHDLQKCVVRDR